MGRYIDKGAGKAGKGYDEMTVEYEKDGWMFQIREGTTDRQAVDEMSSCDFYDLSRISEAKTVLDIGAHIGTFSVKAARKFSDARIYAFEPMDENYDLLLDNVKDLNVIPIRMAVHGENPPIEIVEKYPDGNTGGTILLYGEGKEVVPSISIWEVMEEIEFVDILKIDCEGGEFEILQFLDLEKVGCLLVEFHTLYHSKKIEVAKRWYDMLDRDSRFETIFSDWGPHLPKLAVMRR